MKKEGYFIERECTEIDSDDPKILQHTRLNCGLEAAGQMAMLQHESSPFPQWDARPIPRKLGSGSDAAIVLLITALLLRDVPSFKNEEIVHNYCWSVSYLARTSRLGNNLGKRAARDPYLALRILDFLKFKPRLPFVNNMKNPSHLSLCCLYNLSILSKPSKAVSIGTDIMPRYVVSSIHHAPGLVR